MDDRRQSERVRRLRALLNRIARSEDRFLRNREELQAFFEELLERGVIQREGGKFRIRWRPVLPF